MFVSMPQFHFCSTFLFIFLYNIIYQFHPYGLNVYLSFFLYIYKKTLFLFQALPLSGESIQQTKSWQQNQIKKKMFE